MGTHQRGFGRAILFAIARHAQELRAASIVLVFVLAPIAAAAQDDSEMPDHYLGDGHVDPGENEAADLARAVQNPVANLISVPFQNNTNFDFGPRERTQNVLNIQPVIPFSLSDDWLMITRAIIPIVSQPSLFPGQDRKNGLGDILLTGFLSPSDQDLWIGGKVLWGAGPAILLPTATDNQIGPGQLGAGPSAVFIAMPGQWVIGSLFSQVWSFTGGSDVDLFTWQYFVNYNLPKGWYLTSSPIITANWKNKSSDTWTVPVGGGFGRVFRVGSLPPMNTSLVAFYNVENPRNVGPDWTLRFTLQFLFPR
jgi:hypothetical protein